MKKIALILLSFMVITSPAFAKAIIDVTVKGMVCDSCASVVSSVLDQKENVENVEINLDNSKVTITMKDGTNISDEEIETTVLNAGYDVEKIKRREKE